MTPILFFLKELVHFICSPHLLTVRERISLGRNGEPVSAESLIYHFHRVKKILDQSVDLENGSLSHFEVFVGEPQCFIFPLSLVIRGFILLKISVIYFDLMFLSMVYSRKIVM